MELYGLNSIGLQRAGFSGETIAALKRAYRLFFNSELNLSQALERARERPAAVPRGRALPRLRRVVRAGRARVSAPLPVGRHRRGRAGPAPRPAPGAARATPGWSASSTSTPSAAAAVADELGTDAVHRPRRRCWTEVEAVTVAVPTPAHARGRAPGARARRPGADGEAARRHARGGRRADRAPRSGPGSSSRSGTSSATTGRSARPSPTWTARGTSRASGWPRSSPAAPTSRWCSTS